MTTEEYEQKKRECWGEYCKQYGHTYGRIAFDFAFDRAYALGKQFGNSEQVDAEGEEMLTVSRKQIDALQGEIFKAIMDAHDADDWQDAAHYILDVMPRSFANLFGSKCRPDEEPHTAEPKFDLGDKAILKGYVCTITSRVYEQGKFVGYKIESPQIHGNATVPESYLEPYTEPTDLNKSSETCTDNCSSQNHFVVKDEMVDNIIKDGFKNHNRLNIAAMAMQGILSNIDLFKNVLETGMETLGGDGISFRAVAKSSFLFADALINEAEEGGSK